MNDITITVVGVVGSDVMFSPGERGARSTFRLASTSRYFDRGSQKWMDGPTTWLDVVCWRKLAEHVNDSIHKGQPVVVVGRMRVRTWENERSRGQATEVTATAVGHDLNRGVSSFRKSQSEPQPQPTAQHESGGEAVA